LKFLIDNMLTPWLAENLAHAGYAAIHVGDVDMSLATDAAILTYAREENLSIVTADADFGSLLALRRWRKPSLLFLKDVPRAREAILGILLESLPSLAGAIEEGSVVTFRRGRIRVRRLPVLP
jgi:predicted nuclease of predicted toxin-antitoxin system